MNTKALKHVRQLFNSADVPSRVNRHNQRAWVRSVRYLGGNWLLAKKVQRKEAV